MAKSPSPPYARLQRLTGSWNGTSKLWFDPATQPQLAPFKAVGKMIVGGRFLELRYSSRAMKVATQGRFIFGFDPDGKVFTALWMDSFHSGDGGMVCRGDTKPGRNSLSVLGDYPDGAGGRWGWRTVFSLKKDDLLVIEAFNLPPGKAPQRALLIELRKR